ncbi:transposase [Blastopirellula marina]|uniref:Transposase IS200-like domain-containing protein n=1 Tax=Blastopirellula marina TaxID=124 RepID=A0A2S8GHU7_9BACT|nr:transposase [Blastopirellula marina]PQO44007.1 hypothetical protein C5Y93_20925 [Blastopirellula marina]
MTTEQLEATTTTPAVAYLLTWTTAGTWFSGEQQGANAPFAAKRTPGARRDVAAVSLSVPQRDLVEATIRDCCQQQGWNLIATNCRSNHAHAIINAAADPQEILSTLQSQTAEQLTAGEPSRDSWWEEKGNIRTMNDNDGVQAAAFYVGVILRRI